jgi:hypothetical protein
MVQQVEMTTDVNSISPDFIYNRMDLFCKDYIVLNVHNITSDYLVEVRILENYAELGIWMMKVTGKELDEISEYIFTNYKEIEILSFYYAITDRIYVAEKHYHVNLPETYEELKGRVSSKSRNTMSRKMKKAEAEYGWVTMSEYQNEGVTNEMISAYFEMKQKTHHIRYNLTWKEYIDKYHVSNIYILYFGGTIAAMILTCEQCSIAYLENLTYDMELSKYSPGMIAYEMVLERLISKGKTAFYLGGGDYDYKKKYDSVETAVTEGKIYRSWLIELKYKWIDFYNKRLYWRIRCWKRKLTA